MLKLGDNGAAGQIG